MRYTNQRIVNFLYITLGCECSSGQWCREMPRRTRNNFSECMDSPKFLDTLFGRRRWTLLNPPRLRHRIWLPPNLANRNRLTTRTYLRSLSIGFRRCSPVAAAAVALAVAAAAADNGVSGPSVSWFVAPLISDRWRDLLERTCYVVVRRNVYVVTHTPTSL